MFHSLMWRLAWGFYLLNIKGVLKSKAWHVSVDNHLAVHSVLIGDVECAGCHIGFFTPNLVALSPTLPVLKYILHYIDNTPAADQKPLYEVCVSQNYRNSWNL